MTLPSHFVKDVVKFIASCNISKACVEVFFGELTCSLLKQIHSLTDNMTYRTNISWIHIELISILSLTLIHTHLYAYFTCNGLWLFSHSSHHTLFFVGFAFVIIILRFQMFISSVNRYSECVPIYRVNVNTKDVYIIYIYIIMSYII